jgi:hypothetical protein
LLGMVGAKAPNPEASAAPELASTAPGWERSDEPSTANAAKALAVPNAVTVQKERLRQPCATLGFNAPRSLRIMRTLSAALVRPKQAGTLNPDEITNQPTPSTLTASPMNSFSHEEKSAN